MELVKDLDSPECHVTDYHGSANGVGRKPADEVRRSRSEKSVEEHDSRAPVQHVALLVADHSVAQDLRHRQREKVLRRKIEVLVVGEPLLEATISSSASRPSAVIVWQSAINSTVAVLRWSFVIEVRCAIALLPSWSAATDDLPRRHLHRGPGRHESRSWMGVFIAFAALVGSKYSRRSAIFPAEARRNTTYS